MGDTAFVLGTILAFLIALVDCFGNPDKIFNHLRFDSGTVLVVFLVIALYLKRREYDFPELLVKVNNFFVFPVSNGLAIGLTILNYYNHANYVFSRFGVNFERITYIALASLGLTLVSLGNIWWRKNYKVMVLLGPLFGFGVLGLMHLWPFDFFRKLVLEDHLIENLQFVVVFVAGLICFGIFGKLLPRRRFWSVCYLLFGIGLMLVSGDEISWGQRIFHFDTPESLQTVNLQEETTVHNLKVVTPYLWGGYMIVGIIGFLGWMLQGEFIYVPWFASSYFAALLIYNLLAPPWRVHRIGEWSEVAELAMYAGILIYCAHTFRTHKGY